MVQRDRAGAGQAGAITAPRIIFRSANHPRMNGVQFYVANEIQKIGIPFDGYAVVPTLEEVTADIISPVVIAGITELQPMHQSGETSGLLQLEGQVDMVAHQRK